MERFSKQDFEDFEKSDNKEHKVISNFVKSGDDWDGKRLVIDMENLYKTGNETDKTEAESNDKFDVKMQSFAKMFEIQFNVTFRFGK